MDISFTRHARCGFLFYVFLGGGIWDELSWIEFWLDKKQSTSCSECYVFMGWVSFFDDALRGSTSSVLLKEGGGLSLLAFLGACSIVLWILTWNPLEAGSRWSLKVAVNTAYLALVPTLE